MTRNPFRILKGIGLLIAIIFSGIFTIYTLAWYAFTMKAQAHIDALIRTESLVITGTQTGFTGYPYPPEVHFSGTITHRSGLKIDTADLYYSGFPAPHQAQFLEASHGIKISSPYLERDLDFDSASIQIRPPYHLPYRGDQESVTKWKNSADPIIIDQLALTSGTLTILGAGTITLDDNLQLKADIAVHVSGADDLLNTLEETHGKKNIAMARSFLNMLSKIDPQTGQSYFETTIKIQNKALYFGPMRISTLPEIQWAQ
jgi:hypothetical protein